ISAEIVGEALAHAAHACGKVLCIKSAHGAEHAGCEEPQRETEHQHRVVSEGKTCVGDHNDAGANCEYEEGEPPADTIRQEATGQVPTKGTDDQYGQIACGVEDGKAALGSQKGG